MGHCGKKPWYKRFWGRSDAACSVCGSTPAGAGSEAEGATAAMPSMLRGPMHGPASIVGPGTLRGTRLAAGSGLSDPRLAPILAPHVKTSPSTLRARLCEALAATCTQRDVAGTGTLRGSATERSFGAKPSCPAAFEPKPHTYVGVYALAESSGLRRGAASASLALALPGARGGAGRPG